MPHEQFGPEEVITTGIAERTGQDTAYRHVLAAATVDDINGQMDAEWDRTVSDGTRPELVQTACDIDSCTPVRGQQNR